MFERMKARANEAGRRCRFVVEGHQCALEKGHTTRHAPWREVVATWHNSDMPGYVPEWRVGLGVEAPDG